MPHSLSNAPSNGWSPPATFDEYRILRLLGRGGMGEVYLAHDTLLDRPVAVKFIGMLEPNEEVREQFLTEARAAARLQHPNVLTIYRVGELDRRPFIIAEFIRGKSLDEVPRPMPSEQVLDLGVGLARGLAAAHRRGVLHRDIKPGNAIIADDGGVKLLDFGLAKFVDVNALQDDLAADGAGKRVPVSRDAPTLDLVVPQEPDEEPDEEPNEGPRSAAEPTSAPVSRREPTEDAMRRPDSMLMALGSTTRDTLIDSLPLSTESASSLIIRGTPHYMAPELWRGEPASRRTDVYSLGALLYELCAGEPPFIGTPLNELWRVAGKRDVLALTTLAPTIDPRLGAVIDKCLRRNPAERYGSGDELREALEQLLPQARLNTVPEGNPYRGLLPFEAEHRALFFGRKEEIGSLLERLRSEPFVLVAGDSGVGKSSLCRAGVLPLVTEGALGGGRTFTEVRLVPGRHPRATLSAALAGVLDLDEQKLAARIRKRPEALGRELRKKLGATSGVILFIDQLEELVTISDADEAASVAEALGYLTTRIPGVRLLMTVRSDFLARVASLPGLGDEIPRVLYFLRPLSPDKIREAVVGPARAKGVSFESDALVDTLVESTARTEGSLPLLQFALGELWEARSHGSTVITTDALSALGGVAGALARHADHVLLHLPPDQRAAARRVLIALVTLDGTRARRSEDELIHGDPSARAALEALVRGRLLVARDQGDGATYEVAHEALLRGWDTLRRWLDEQADSRAVKHRLETSAAEWERLGRAREALWSTRQVTEAAILDAAELGPREASFLRASKARMRRDRRVKSALLVGVPAVLALLFGLFRLSAHRDVERRVTAHVSEANEHRAEASRTDTEHRARLAEAFAAFDDKRLADGEKLWARSLDLAKDLEQAYGRASQALEAALTIDGGREDVRGMLGDVLYDRALAAEQNGELLQRDDLLHRLALYDTGGERRERFSAPAALTIATTPPGARVTLARFEENEQQKRVLTGDRDLGATPVPELPVARGSYLLTLTADGRAPVRYPLVLERGERLKLAIDLPPLASVPAGFVYIPPGRFVFGSSADEQLRREFLTTVPAHHVTTGAYLIARNETTYGEWIEYLRALPREARARRTAKIGKADVSDALALVELERGGWQLTLRPTTQTHTARSGEMIRYSTRTRRVEQSWLRFPVGGVSAEDGAAYAAWLDRTGRVRGARLCTEYEWERAARGADDREYPGGDRLDPDDANYDETYGMGGPSMGPDEVGSHPASSSPFNVLDMAGNISEWVISSLDLKAYGVRGGAYYYGQMTARSTNRATLDGSLMDPRFGLRICATPSWR